MLSLEFKKEKSVLLIIDMQNAFISPKGSLATMGLDTSRVSKSIEPIKKIADAFRQANRPVIYIQHTHRPDGLDYGLISHVFPPLNSIGHCIDGTWDQEIIDELIPHKSDIIVKKHRFSSFYGTQLENILHSLDAETLVVTGISTNICVESTIRDAFYRDYNVFVPADATAAFTEAEENASIGNFHFAFARVINTEDIIEKIK